MRPVTVRGMFVAVAVGAVAIAAAFSYFAALSSVGSVLRDTIPDVQVARLARAVGLSILAATSIALGLATLLALYLSGQLERSLAELRDSLSRAGAGRIRNRNVDAVRRASQHTLQAERAGAAISERGRAELAGILDAVGEGMLQIDRAGRIVWLNRAAQELLRLPSRSIGQLATLLVRRRELRRWLDRGLSGEDVSPLEVRMDGRQILVSMDQMDAHEPEAGPRWILTFVDLTELRRLESVRRDFIANASHELKTPLTSIRGYAETLLTDQPEPEVMREFLATIHKNAERMHRIVDDLLDLSRIESGSWQPHAGAVGVAPAAADAWSACVRKAEAKQLRLDVVDEHDLHVTADPLALSHIFSNLFDNAIRYAEAGTTVQVRASKRDGAPEWVHVAVEDRGTGIPRESLPRIFERFYRADPARSREEGGTGLGLAIVKHMVEAMGGRVHASSQIGQGTTISFELPAA